MIIFLSIGLNMCFVCSKEPSHRDGSFEYHNTCFGFKIRKIIFQLRTLIWGPVLMWLFSIHGFITIVFASRDN